ncbi:ACP S-malonyltransferase [Paenibacillus arenosi]|uniref:Malonyl CoA-acyl carrier protein transacylase n=1 Tax=Paenibacillus arenosi TaxID=2774142 RepID=A0ABR9AWU9_9BACL|nr:ACP S-malonyltransferase [Paenibacillus arenosi]MBD8498173.1 ACP S-malonyltransferase [Paenibacillus arenosi]
MGKVAFLFPGQGSQIVGMGKNYARRFGSDFESIFDEASDALGFDLRQLCYAGPERDLMKTEIAQPAIVTVSSGILRVLIREGLCPDIVAGHSVGQYSALVAAGVLSFADAVKLVRKRGEFMAAVRTPGTMAAVVVSQPEQMSQVIAEVKNMELDIAGMNTPSQIVVSGANHIVPMLLEQLQAIQGIRTKPLAVSHAFHSRLMIEMEEPLMAYAAGLSFYDAQVPVVLNETAKVTTAVVDIVEDIRAQCTKPVAWRQTIEAIGQYEVQHVIEVGAGNTLTGMMRSFGSHWKGQSTNSPMELEKVLQLMRKFKEGA